MRTVFNLVYRENLLAPRCFYICTEYYKYICNPLVIYIIIILKKKWSSGAMWSLPVFNRV